MVELKEIKTVALYMRVSTDEERQNVDNQRLVLQEFAKDHEWEVYKEYVDHASGGNPNRPAFSQMMKDARSRKFQAILVVRIDRVMRDTFYLLSFLRKIDQYRVRLVCTSEPYDTATPEGRLALEITSSFASFERERIGQRIRDGQARARKQGKITGRRRKSYDRSTIIEIKQKLDAGELNLFRASVDYDIPRTSLRRELSKLGEIDEAGEGGV